MPLPRNGSLALQGQGSTSSLGPMLKKAMIVKLSDEILDALLVRRSDQPTDPALDVVFGDSPGIHVGNMFFPAHILKEDNAHELFIRSDKPLAPLRHHAFVQGKLTVARELDSRTENKVRSRGEELGRISKDRKIQVLETPPSVKSKATGKSNKKKSGSSSLVKQVARVDPPRRPIPVVEVPPAASNHKAPSPSSKDDLLRIRLIHYLALAPASTSDVIQNVGGAERDTMRNAIADLLTAVASEDPPARRSNLKPPLRVWRLKSESWLDVRPFDYPKLTDAERKNMSLQAKMQLTRLKIPESDPRWDHVHSRTMSINGSNGMKKDNSVGRASTPIASSEGQSKLKKPSRELEHTTLKTQPTQRGTGNTKTGVERTRELSPLISPHSSLLKSRTTVTKVGEITPQQNSSPREPLPRLNRSSPSVPTKAQAAIETVKTRRPSPTLKERIKRKKSSDDDEDVERDLKRKRPVQENVGRSSTENRKLYTPDVFSNDTRTHGGHTRTISKDDASAVSSTSGRTRTADPAQMKGHRPSASYDEKRRPAPKSNGSLSKKRRSPIYTSSSEDDGDRPTPSKGGQRSANQSAKGGRGQDHGHSKGYVRPSVKLGGPLPSDRSSLRRAYGSIYPVYLNLFQRCMEQRAAIERVLGEVVAPEDGEVEEDLGADVDLDVMDASDLEKLTADCGRMERELNRIKDALKQTTTDARPKDKEPMR